MSKKNPFKKITLETLPNGYALTVDVDHYMYFNEEDLLTGFFAHVGLKMSNPLDKDLMRDLMTACAIWPHEGEAIQAAAKMERIIEELRQKSNRDTDTIRDLKARIETLTKKLDETTMKLKRYIDPRLATTDSNHVNKVDIAMPKTAAQKETTIITCGDLAPRANPATKAKAKPEVTIPYSEAVYNALMLPLTIDKTGLNTRALSIMKMVGGSKNDTVGDALIHPKKEFMKIRGFGPVVANNIENFLDRNHLAYAMNVEEILMQHAMRNNPNIK